MSINLIRNQLGYIDPKITRILHDCIIEGDKTHRIYSVVVHRFKIGDVDDPEIYAAQPIWEWQQTEAGKWIMERAVESPKYHQHIDSVWMGYCYAITAKLKEKDYTYWCLKWADTVDKT
jgi:hypothetical protein